MIVWKHELDDVTSFKGICILSYYNGKPYTGLVKYKNSTTISEYVNGKYNGFIDCLSMIFIREYLFGDSYEEHN